MPSTKKKRPKVTIGFDPEYLVKELVQGRTVTGGGALIPICGRLGGTKKSPVKFSDPEYSYHEDNVAAEINVPYSDDPYVAIERLSRGIEMLRQKLNEKNLMLDDRPAYQFSKKDLACPEAHEFGCDPDFDAYVGGEQRYDVPDFGTWRFAGGHIHLGGEFNCPQFVVALMLDMALLPYSGDLYKHTLERRKWYGRPGVFRPKPYGIEYRSLSSAWTLDDHRRYDIVHRAQKMAIWLSSASPTRIKNLCDSMNWLAIREYYSKASKDVERTKAPPEYSNSLKRARRMGAPV